MCYGYKYTSNRTLKSKTTKHQTNLSSGSDNLFTSGMTQSKVRGVFFGQPKDQGQENPC
jgi:hypothetical protein